MKIALENQIGGDQARKWDSPPGCHPVEKAPAPFIQRPLRGVAITFLQSSGLNPPSFKPALPQSALFQCHSRPAVMGRSVGGEDCLASSGRFPMACVTQGGARPSLALGWLVLTLWAVLLCWPVGPFRRLADSEVRWVRENPTQRIPPRGPLFESDFRQSV